MIKEPRALPQQTLWWQKLVGLTIAPRSGWIGSWGQTPPRIPVGCSGIWWWGDRTSPPRWFKLGSPTGLSNYKHMVWWEEVWEGFVFTSIQSPPLPPKKKIPKSHTPGLDVNLWESRNSSQLPSTQDNASWLPKSHPRVGRAPTVLVRYPEVNQVDNTHLQSKNDGEILPTALSLCSHQSTGTQYGSYRPFGESQLARGVHGVLGFSSTCGWNPSQLLAKETWSIWRSSIFVGSSAIVVLIPSVSMATPTHKSVLVPGTKPSSVFLPACPSTPWKATLIGGCWWWISP